MAGERVQKAKMRETTGKVAQERKKMSVLAVTRRRAEFLKITLSFILYELDRVSSQHSQQLQEYC